jgi:hypothetical protein
MSHVDDGQLHALVDNELDETERTAVEAHLASCGDCAKRFADATAMARQTMSLLAMLDESPARVVITPPAREVDAPVLPSDARVIVRKTFFTARRIAIAASLLLVASVSYQVGRRGDVVSAPAASKPMAAAAPAARPMNTAVSVVDAAPDSFVAAAAPSVRQTPRGGPRADAAEDAATPAPAAPASPARLAPVPLAAVPMQAPIVTSSEAADVSRRASAESEAMADRAGGQRVEPRAEQRGDQRGEQSQNRERSDRRSARDADGAGAQSVGATQRASQSVAQSAEPAPAPAAARAAAVSAAPATSSFAEMSKAAQLAGYTAVENDVLPSVTRRRYVSATGTPLLLVIVQAPADPKKVRAGAPPEYVVTTTNGRSVVRWSNRGLEYELQGPLTADSLVKLAVQLR